ncbi:hypothetical protein BCR37DRAFT_240715 [Protomyces lactucae-debilis]|uniref:Uncharacterized protein n=1 Tax=Protomyces lactucae-debilis TaxID=2754530 RepID=A0A1Y2FND4_PROLT|nr:uncharacterized protein BCR37DRAFT_240715 [Protomyces lactucae-debilis]ORY85520.1 hypothetical protein BCR37DRAFT_240715 [Protomyces lactucae-debilis]
MTMIMVRRACLGICVRPSIHPTLLTIDCIANADLVLLLADILEILHNNTRAPLGTERLMLSSLLNFRAGLLKLIIPNEHPLASGEHHQAICHLQLHLSFMACWILTLKSLMTRPQDATDPETPKVGSLDLSLGVECIAEYCKLLSICGSIEQWTSCVWPGWMEHAMLLVVQFTIRLVAGSVGLAQQQALSAARELFRILHENQKIWHIADYPLRVLVASGIAGQ